ncbi:MAG: hypothetical protein HYV09_17255 [Deltaproteobacteria bacterium]|nr:hypothetical protein [Deltaproteobacteria bacterium]
MRLFAADGDEIRHDAVELLRTEHRENSVRATNGSSSERRSPGRLRKGVAGGSRLPGMVKVVRRFRVVARGGDLAGVSR